MLHRVYHRQIYSVDALKRRLIDVWCGLELSIFYEAIDQWRGRHRACASVAVRQRLQRIQNSADRLVCSEPAFSHAAPLLHSLHWLPVPRRIKYKLCVLMFDVYHGTAPVYMTDLCSRCNDDRLRSSARGNFLVRRTRTRFANSSFTVAGPAAWNSLPAHTRTIDSHSAHSAVI